MNQLEITNCLELDNLILTIQKQTSLIEQGDLSLQINILERYPYFDSRNILELRKNALYEYYVMLINAFFSACKLTYETSAPVILETVDACVMHLNGVLASRSFDVQQLPMAKTLYDLYNCTYAKLLKAKLNKNASNLKQLKNRIFMGWRIISSSK
ncbi:MAG: hypothetical protein J6X10_03690 [Bacteroidales bacterium]|nr:hypothetical protein [Bacteroidales bacterium]